MPKKTKLAKVLQGTITLQLNNRTVTPVSAEEALICCTKCCFGFEGRAQRTCPSVNGTNLCVAIKVDNNHTYFKEESNDMYSNRF